MEEIKGYILSRVVLVGLIGSLIWNGIAYALTFVYWGVNPIFPPPLIMVFPAAIITVFSDLPWNPYGGWQFYIFVSIPIFWIIFFCIAWMFKAITKKA
jgi:hypothetical protein